MTQNSGTFSTGALFQATLPLPTGNHTFAFVYPGGTNNWADPFAPALYAGPAVSTTPVLATGAIILPTHTQDPDLQGFRQVEPQ